MQQLHLVGLTTDLDSIICSARKGAKSGSFVLPLDEHLLQVIAEAVSRRNADGVEIEVPEALQPPSAAAPRRQSHLSPREIQDRLRAGRSLEDIAAEAGVGEEWVARFAAPVEAERSQVVGRARRLTYYRTRRGDSGEPLGMAVRWNLADRGVRLANDEFDAAWSAYQLADTAWMVTFSYEARKREHEAEWEVDLATNELLSRNRLATELGYVEPGRRRRGMASLQPVAPASAAGARARTQDVASGASGEASGERARGRDGAESGSGGGRAVAASRGGAKKAGASSRPGARSTAGKAASKSRGKKAGGAVKAGSRAAPKATAAAKKAAGTGRAGPRGASKAPAKRPTKTAARRNNSPAKRATKTSAKTAKAPATRPVTRAASRPVKAAAKKATTRRTGRGAPPGQVPATPVGVVDDRPVPNELGRRRMQLVSGTAPSRPPSRMGVSGRPAPSMSGVRIAAVRSGDVAAAPRPIRRPDRSERLERGPAPTAPDEIAAAESGLDVTDSEAAAEARRAERRRARAARSTPVAWSAGHDAAGGEDADDGRVVTIRANRATPPRGDAELVLPADRPPLRPAQPAAQPRKRLFNRTGR